MSLSFFFFFLNRFTVLTVAGQKLTDLPANLPLNAGIKGMYCHAQPIFFFFPFEAGSHCVDQNGLKIRLPSECWD